MLLNEQYEGFIPNSPTLFPSLESCCLDHLLSNPAPATQITALPPLDYGHNTHTHTHIRLHLGFNVAAKRWQHICLCFQQRFPPLHRRNEPKIVIFSHYLKNWFPSVLHKIIRIVRNVQKAGRRILVGVVVKKYYFKQAIRQHDYLQTHSHKHTLQYFPISVSFNRFV